MDYHISIMQRRLIVVTIVGSIIATKISDILFGFLFKDFWSKSWDIALFMIGAYLVEIVIVTAFILLVLFKIFKLKL